MVAKEISSLQHPLIKLSAALRIDKQTRESENKVVISGKKVLLELPRLQPFFFTHGEPPPHAEESIRVSPQVMKKITGLEESDGWAALVEKPKPTPLSDKRRLLVLDHLSDPGNLGTLWRTAFALGWEGVWLLPGTVDPFNDKALRAAKGATFRLPYEWVESEDILRWQREKQGTLLAADLTGEPLSENPPAPPIALILGSEGQGLHPWAEFAAKKVTIPLSSHAESLNVAAAGAIFLYALRAPL